MRSTMDTALARPRALIRSDAVQRLLAFGALLVLIVVFSLLSSNFLTFDNAIGILLATSVNGILALGVTFVIITGGIDLSIGTVMTLAAVITGVVTVNTAVSVGETPIRSAMPMPIGAVSDFAYIPPTMVSSAPSNREIATAVTMEVTPPPTNAAPSGSNRPRSEGSPL